MKQSLADAREALDREEYTRALEIYTRVANSYPDLALSHGCAFDELACSARSDLVDSRTPCYAVT